MYKMQKIIEGFESLDSAHSFDGNIAGQKWWKMNNLMMEVIEPKLRNSRSFSSQNKTEPDTSFKSCDRRQDKTGYEKKIINKAVQPIKIRQIQDEREHLTIQQFPLAVNFNLKKKKMEANPYSYLIDSQSQSTHFKKKSLPTSFKIRAKSLQKAMHLKLNPLKDNEKQVEQKINSKIKLTLKLNSIGTIHKKLL